MIRFFLLAALAAAPLPALAQEGDGAAGKPPQRIRSVTVYGDEPCPESSEEEIVVCGRMDENERYRIPPKLREHEPGAGSTAWAARVETVTEVNRVGLPNSCSPVGTGGQTGCTQAMLRQWFLDRRAQQAEAAGVP